MLSILSTNLCHEPSPLQKAPAILYLKLLRTEQCVPHSMARADCQDIELNSGDVSLKPKDKSFIEHTIDIISKKNSKDLIYGRYSVPVTVLTPSTETERPPFAERPPFEVERPPYEVEKPSYEVERPSYEAERPALPQPPIPPDPNPPKPTETFKSNEEPTNLSKQLFDKPAFLPPKAISHSKISPSSIPNPSPSISTTKQLEPGYPNYGNYLYSLPGYSAFQPLSYPGLMPSHTSLTPSENSNFVPYSSIANKIKENISVDEKISEAKTTDNQIKDAAKPQTDFEEQFTPEIIPAAPTTTVQDSIQSQSEAKMCITSLAQGSGATVTITSQICNKDLTKKKPPERFSLKTSIPISKIDMKCVGNPPEPIVTNPTPKKTVTFSPLLPTKSDPGPKVEIQSNIIIRGPTKEMDTSEAKQTPILTNISSNFKNSTEAVNKNDSQFKKPEPKNDVGNEVKDPSANLPPPSTTSSRTAIPMNTENKVNFQQINKDKVNIPKTIENKANFQPKPQDGNLSEQKNQILLIQNKNQNPKMLLTIQQQNPQVLLQRTNFESKNVVVPSRLSSQSKSKEENSENGASSKVVALKRLHQENCDENDFENLITENQIYGNKIVVKEKSQRTLQEQELKSKKIEKPIQETKNVVLQPNFVYLSNVQFPANLMMIKNNTNVNQSTDINKVNKMIPNENKVTNDTGTMTNSIDINSSKNKTPNVVVSKEIHVLKSSNNVLQTLSNKNTKSEIVLQSHQKVIMNPQILYQIPIVEADNKFSQPFLNTEYQKLIGQKKEYPKQEQKSTGTNDKVYIACPYQVDPSIQPKYVIANIRPKVAKVDEVSSLDFYEKRKRMRRLKYLSSRDITKEIPKVDNTKKVPERVDIQRNLITPDMINDEICKEFSNSKGNVEEVSSDSESDCDENDLNEYEAIINMYGPKTDENAKVKADFLEQLSLGTRDVILEKELDRQERIIQRDSVASAYIAAGRIDRLTNEDSTLEINTEKREQEPDLTRANLREEGKGVLAQKQKFLSLLKLAQVTPQYKEGYEKVWQAIVNERKRRNGEIITEPTMTPSKQQNLELDPNGQLQILTEIKKCVNENNNLIKRKLDSADSKTASDGESIHILAEKNFSELNRLSKMADRSVKLITGQDTRKRDLNPGFDSENIQKPVLKLAPQPVKTYPNLNVPKIAKIISLKSQDSVAPQVVTTCKATSMDEPVNSAAGVEVVDDQEVSKTRDFGCQVEETLQWPGWEAVMKSYRVYDAARRKQLNELHRRNTALRVEGAHITRGVSSDTDQSKALLAERQHLANEEAAVKRSLQRLTAAIEAIKNS